MSLPARPRLVPNASNVPLTLSARVPYTLSSFGASVPYVLDILSYSSFYAALASDNTVKLFDAETLKNVADVPRASTSNSGRITSISRNIEGTSGEVLLVTEEDGSVDVRDLRTGGGSAQGGTVKGSNGAPCLCASLSTSGTYLASGTELYQHEASIRIHDLRNPSKPLHLYSDAHSDDLSSLSFHPSNDTLLLSGSVDGLTSTIDVSIADEDDAILHTANVGASISKSGWMSLPGKSWGGTFAVTDMETVQIYDALDEMSLVREFGDVRELEDPSWQTHYIIDCIGTDGGLALLTGQREGAFSIIQAPLQGDWSIEQVLQNGHSDIVRSATVNLSRGTIVSGGEDGLMCLWSVPTTASTGMEAQGNASASPGQRANSGRDKSSRYTPY